MAEHCDLRHLLERHGQERVLQFWAELSDAQRDAFEREIRNVDLATLQACLREPSGERNIALEQFSPADFLPAHPPANAATGPIGERDFIAIEQGRKLLIEGRVACVTVAGGQASRLGLEFPKGCLPIGPLSRRTLFAVFADQLRAIGERCGTVPSWWILTSPFNEHAIRAFFSGNHFFGLDPGQVGFIVQGTIPAIDDSGDLLLADTYRLFQNPDGHGGLLRALRSSGAIGEMADLGIEHLFSFQVDNPLVKVADPLFLGQHLLADAELSCKLVRKSAPMEKLGCIGWLDGRLTCVEYSDLPPEIAAARDTSGELVHVMGGISIYVFKRSFLERFNASGMSLPYHKARKLIPALDENGRLRPIEGIKFETFLFDVLPHAERVLLVETLREEEFSPVKNRDGADTPQSAREALLSLHRDWLESAGIAVPSGTRVEISPRWAIDREEVQQRAAGWVVPKGNDWYLSLPGEVLWRS